MARTLHIHPETPQPRLIREAANTLRDGGLIVLPTDCCHVLACGIGDKSAMTRLRQVRAINDKHLLTLICNDLSDLGAYARIDNVQYRFLKAVTPGAYTFILEASKELPRRILDPRRKTIGLRIPNLALVHQILEETGEPLLSSSLIMPGDTEPLSDLFDIEMQLDHQVDLILDIGRIDTTITTVVDLTASPFQVTRVGAGPLSPLGLSEN